MTLSIAGTNWFGVKTKLDELVNVFASEHGELAIEKIDGAEASYEQILGAIESLPLLTSKKMVIIQQLSINKEASEALEKLVESVGDTTELIILESKLDKRSVYFKQLKKLTNYQEFGELDEAQLPQWLAGEAEKLGATITYNNSGYLVERVGANQTQLLRELEKLALYNSEISRKNIDLLTDENPSSTIFNLIDSAFSGDLKKALVLYGEQRMQRVEPQAIHAMLVWQMHAVALVSSASKETSTQKIAQDTGMNPYVVQKSQRIAQKMGRSKISEFMQLLRDIDYKSKQTAIDYDEALRYAILSLAN